MEKKTFKEQQFKDILTTSLWKLVGMIGMGFLLGYLVYRDSERDKNPQIMYLWFMVLLFTLIGIIIFLVKVIPAYNKVLKERKEKNEDC